MPLQKSRRRRARSFSTPWRLRMTGWLALNLSATSCAEAKDVGETTVGLDVAGTWRTTGLGWTFGAEGTDSMGRSLGGRGRTADTSPTGSGGGGGAAGRVRGTVSRTGRAGAAVRVTVWAGADRAGAERAAAISRGSRAGAT